MLKLLKSKKAQAVAAEYVLLFFLIVGTMTAMSIYFRRTIQARIHDARDTMVDIVRTRAAGQAVGNLYVEYEPYYANTASRISRDGFTKEELLQGGASRITYDENTAIRTTSETAPPKEGNLW